MSGQTSSATAPAEGDATPFELLLKCVETHRIDVLRSLLAELGRTKDAAAVLDRSCTRFGTLLHYAVQLNDVDAVRTLCAAGASTCILNSAGQNPFQMAQTETIAKVFEQELFQAVAQSRISRVCQLLSCGLTVDILDSSSTRNSLLHWAASYANCDTVSVLCEGGADVNFQNALGDTPLHDAVRRRCLEIVQKLTAYGANPYLRNAKDESPLSLSKSSEAMSQIFAPTGDPRRNSATDVSMLNIVEDTATECISNGFVDNNGGSSKTLADHNVNRDKLLLSPVLSLSDHISNQQMLGPDSSSNSLVALPDFVRPLTISELLLPTVREFNLTETASSANGVSVEDILCKRLSFVIDRNHRVSLAADGLPDFASVRMQLACYKALLESNGLFEVTFNEEKALPSTLPKHRSALMNVRLVINSQLFNRENEYKLNILPSAGRCEIVAQSLSGLHCAMRTFVCVLLSNKLSVASPLYIRDWPQVKYRGLVIDCSPWRCFTIDALSKLIRQLALIKINLVCLRFVLVSAENGNRVFLPFSAGEILKLMQIADECSVAIAPSISSSVPINDQAFDEAALLNEFAKVFELFPFSSSSSFVHFSADFALLMPKLLHRSPAFRSLLHRFSLAFVPFNLADMESATTDHICNGDVFSTTNNSNKNNGSALFSAQIAEDLPVNVVLTHSASSPICSSENDDDAVKTLLRLTMLRGVCIEANFNAVSNASLLTCPSSLQYLCSQFAKLLDAKEGLHPIAVLLSEPTFTDRTFPIYSLQASGYVAEVLMANLSWSGDAANSSAVLRRLPFLIAQHLFQSEKTALLWQIAMHLSAIESCLTSKQKGPHRTVSLLRQLLVAPDTVALDGLDISGVTFKRKRIELSKLYASLSELKKKMTYDFEIALCLAELEATLNCLIIAARLGQALCVIGRNPVANDHTLQLVNVGVANLPITTRTDLANRLIEVKAVFRHVWLARHLSATLPSAMTHFDRLIDKLLPGSILLQADGIVNYADLGQSIPYQN